MRDVVLTALVAVLLTVAAVYGLELERRVGPVGITFAMCVLIAGIMVRVITDAVQKRRSRR